MTYTARPQRWRTSLRRPRLKPSSRKLTHRALQVRLDFATAICRLCCMMNWSSISPHSRYLYFQRYSAPSILDTAHTSANSSALGQKARQVACGDVLRRFIGAGFNRRCGMKLADYFQPWGQYGVAIPRVEIMALTGTLGFDEGFTILPYDGENASNSIYCHRFLHALVEIVPSVVPYASRLCAQEPPKRLFALDGGGFGSGGVSV